MAIQRMDNGAIVVEDLDAAAAFFTELGTELEGTGQVEGLLRNAPSDYTAPNFSLRWRSTRPSSGSVTLRGPAGIIVTLACQKIGASRPR